MLQAFIMYHRSSMCCCHTWHIFGISFVFVNTNDVERTRSQSRRSGKGIPPSLMLISLGPHNFSHSGNCKSTAVSVEQLQILKMQLPDMCTTMTNSLGTGVDRRHTQAVELALAVDFFSCRRYPRPRTRLYRLLLRLLNEFTLTQDTNQFPSLTHIPPILHFHACITECMYKVTLVFSYSQIAISPSALILSRLDLRCGCSYLPP